MSKNTEGLTLGQLGEINAGLHAEVARLNEQVRALAADNVALINSSVRTLQDGRPPHGFYESEWFIAKLKNGQFAALKALPEKYSHDYSTNDGTYYTKDWVVGWMQTPDTEYRPNVETPATEATLNEVRAQGVDMYAEHLTRKAIESGENKNHAYAYLAANFAARIRAGEVPDV
ncbi:hypothetical protein [Erwinia sp. Leaf53]|uniref:hypothetical protein n=1 Tax=Erwinia sp. Leaf53 TaxID=1736225 RepID=UPI0006F64A92|nr:hypothetical protein [Erwinia sp. Leaf53]KQN53173.1 hypothetical protein ASF13_16365 [Erwinia sp. Leaf53]